VSLVSARRPPPFTLLLATALLAAFGADPARSEGEPVAGFPGWAERVLHAWINRARVEPAAELAPCSADPAGCPDAPCYVAREPLGWSYGLARAARFHSEQMTLLGFFGHNSVCTLVADINALYPATCDGAAGCACVGGVAECSPACTVPPDRAGLFGAVFGGEIITSTSDPDAAFLSWVLEETSQATCDFTLENGHRWLILKATGVLGAGVAGVAGDSTVDFGPGPAPGEVPSGAHYPRQASSVEVWTNWYDSQGPLAAKVNVGGTCAALVRERGTATNGAWTATVSGVGSGCHRYYFEFLDSEGQPVTYPTTGSFGIGPAGTCADWVASRPASCVTLLFADGFETGDASRWSSASG
jgi:hypothetical protein